MNRTVAILGLLALGVLPAGCAVPEFDIRPAPANAVVYVDGSRVARRKDDPLPGARVPLRYYGTFTVGARQLQNIAQPDADPVAAPARRLDERQKVVVDEPFTPWIFPFDFFLEAFTYPFRNLTYRRRIVLELPPRPPLVGGLTLRSLVEAIRERARRAVLER